jgi:hypothetical protein
MKLFILGISSLLVVGGLCSCQSAINKAGREAKYSALEMVGVQKRDLFKKDVKDVKEDQEEAGEAFKDALEAIQKTYGIEGGNLEKQYRQLNGAYEDAQKRADDVHKSTLKLETLSQDLFAEWKKEISEMTSPELRAKSSGTLVETQKKYREFYSALKKSEARMDPVLSKFKDHVLFLKHNLNAKAITGLKGESTRIQGEIETLIKDMNASIQQAGEFIKTM